MMVHAQVGSNMRMGVQQHCGSRSMKSTQDTGAINWNNKYCCFNAQRLQNGFGDL